MKKITRKMKLNLAAGTVNPGTVGKDLAPTGISLIDFCKQYNELTKNDIGKLIPAKVTVYDDRSFDIEVTSPPTSFLIKEAAGIKKGASKTGHEIIGRITVQQVQEIAEKKYHDMNASTIQAAMKMVIGTAKNMGISIIE